MVRRISEGERVQITFWVALLIAYPLVSGGTKTLFLDEFMASNSPIFNIGLGLGIVLFTYWQLKLN